MTFSKTSAILMAVLTHLAALAEMIASYIGTAYWVRHDILEVKIAAFVIWFILGVGVMAWWDYDTIQKIKARRRMQRSAPSNTVCR